MKIAFSGPSGLGKTTLCKYVQQEFGTPWLSTSAGDILSPEVKDHFKVLFQYKGSGHRDVINLSSQYPSFGAQFQQFLLEARGLQIKDNETFIIDRCPIDNVSYMLSQNSHNMDEDKVRSFISKAQEIYRELDIVIQIRFSSEIPSIEDNGSRVSNRFYQQYMSDVFTGVFSRYFAPSLQGPKVYTIDFWDLVQRKRLVYDVIKSFLK